MISLKNITIAPRLDLYVPCHDLKFKVWDQLLAVLGIMVYEVYHPGAVPVSFVVHNFTTHATVLNAMYDVHMKSDFIYTVASHLDLPNYTIQIKLDLFFDYRFFECPAIDVMARLWFAHHFGIDRDCIR